MNNLINEIGKDYYRFDMVQLVDVIREIFDGEIFFEADPSFAFPANDIGGVAIGGDGRAAIRLSMLGTLGVTGALPVGFSDYANRGKKGAALLVDFLSVMQNRLHALWVDTHRKYSLWRDGGDPARRIFELVTSRPLDRFLYCDMSWLSAFSRRTRSAYGLKRIIRSVWRDIPVSIEENVGRWTTVENRSPVGRGTRLGQGAFAGSKIYDRTAKFRIALGTLAIDTYRSFLPDERNYKFLTNIVAQYINAPLICELEISCRQDELEPARLDAGRGVLGRTLTLGRCGDGRIHRYRVNLTPIVH